MPRHRGQAAGVEEGEAVRHLHGYHQADGDHRHIEQPGPCHQQYHEEKEIDQHLDRDRPDRSIEAQCILDGGVARHQQLQHEISEVVVLIAKEISSEIKI